MTLISSVSWLMVEGIPVLWERHLQSGLLALLSIASVAITTATISAGEDIAVVKNDLQYIQGQLDIRMGDRWTASDHRAYAEFDALRAENVRKDVERIAQLIKELEARFDGTD